MLLSRSVLSDMQEKLAGRLLAQGPDWELLVRVARFHKVFPIFYANLVRYFSGAVPDKIGDKLKSRFLSNSASSLFLSDQLLHILRLFEKERITAVPFKGPVLADYLYGDISCRSFTDLDILISGADLDKAVNLLRSSGFRFDIDLSPAQFLRLARDGFHAGLIHEGPPFLVELHWEMTGRYVARNMELADVESRLRKVRFLGLEILALAPEDLLVYLCIHGNRHYWLQLDFICCVAELLRKEKDLDWDLAVRLAEGYGARRMLLLGCYLAAEVLGVQLAGNVDALIAADPVVQKVGNEVRNMLWTNSGETGLQMSYRNELRYHWQTLDRFADRMRMGMRPLFQPTHSDWQWLPLPVSLSRLYYVLRPLRLGVKYGKRLFEPAGRRGGVKRSDQEAGL